MHGDAEPAAPSASDDDAALLDAARSGDERALAKLVERHAPSVLRFGLKLCRDEEQARDVMQETLLAAARGLRTYRGESRLSTWLYTIARSFCIKQRTRGDSGKGHESLDQLGGGDAERALADHAANRLAPDEALESRELQAILTQAIRELEPGQREVLVLRDVEGLSAPEVAKVLDVSVDAVKSRLHRARAALRERLAPLVEAPTQAPARSDCPDIVNLLSRHLEDDVSPDLCRSMEAHLAQCPRCTARCDSLRAVLATCSSAPLPELSPQLRGSVVEEMRRALVAARGG